MNEFIESFLNVITLLEKEQIPYMVVGSLASMIYGEPRLNLVHHESGLKVDCILRKQSPHALKEFSRRRLTPFWGEQEVFVASPEDVIIKKLEYFREGGSEKHLKDVRGILGETELDNNYLSHWIKELVLEKQWKQVEE